MTAGIDPRCGARSAVSIVPIYIWPGLSGTTNGIKIDSKPLRKESETGIERREDAPHVLPRCLKTQTPGLYLALIVETTYREV
jgi:hypothetical protein